MDGANAHGRLVVPTTRIGHAGYENDPVGFAGGNAKDFVCRNAPNNNLTPVPVTAGSTLDLTYRLTAAHVGDAAVYISYDYDEPYETQENMLFFKIANIPKAKDNIVANSEAPVTITLPEWLPAGRATLRWEWYALHVNPTIELYVQCAPIVITAKAGYEKTLAEVRQNSYKVFDQIPKTLYTYNTDMTKYRNPYGSQDVNSVTGPECAFGSTLNDCELSALGTLYHVDMFNGNGPVYTTPAPATNPVTTPPPVTTPSSSAAPTTKYPTGSGITAPGFMFDTSTALNTRKTLANIGGLLAQCKWESATWTACDENNYTGWATASCTQRGDGQLYSSLTGPDACAVDTNMQMTAETWASWAPGPMQCGPSNNPGCCWWGRGAIQTTGPNNYGKLQKDVIAFMPGYENIDLCTNPEAICQNDGLKFLGALYYWTDFVQPDTCFTGSIEAYAQSFDNYAAAPGNCAKYSAGIGGSINNGIWNKEAHGEYGRQANFQSVMEQIKIGLSAYEAAAAAGQAPTPTYTCTGDNKIDLILELGNVKDATQMEDAGSVYTWEGFCGALRLFLDVDPNVVPPGTTSAPVTAAPVTTVAPVTTPASTTPQGTPGCVDENKRSGSRCNGEASRCCATGTQCYMYDQEWSGCYEYCPTTWLCHQYENGPDTSDPVTPITTNTPPTPDSGDCGFSCTFAPYNSDECSERTQGYTCWGGGVMNAGVAVNPGCCANGFTCTREGNGPQYWSASCQ